MKLIMWGVLSLGLFSQVTWAADEVNSLELTDAKIFAPLKGTNATAAYGTFKNKTGKTLEITADSSADFKAIELHQTLEKDGKMAMQKMEKITLKPNESYELKPGGNHIMLFDPKREITLNEELKLNLMVSGKKEAYSFKVVPRLPKEVANPPSHEHMHMAEKAEVCSYELDKKSVAVAWTAFKTTEKVGVNGSFKTVEVKGKEQAKSLAILFKGLTVNVDKLSVDTANPARDVTLTDFFFKKIAKNISGKIKSVNEKEASFVLSLNFNGKVKDVKMTYSSSEDGKFKATGEMDVLNFSAQKALASLNEKCVDLHKGADGVSKTWPNVVINLSGSIARKCK